MDRGPWITSRSRNIQSWLHHGAITCGNAGLAHNHGDAGGQDVVKLPAAFLHQSLVVAANDLLLGGLPADLIIGDAVASHVYPHIGGGRVGGITGEFFHQKL